MMTALQTNERPTIMRNDIHSRQDNGRDFVTLLFNQSMDGIMVIDSKGVVCLANPKAEELFGTSVEHLEGHLFGVPALNEPVEIQLHHAAEPRTIEMRAKQIEWQGEIAFLTFLRDITDRTQAQNRLRFSEQKYRQLFNHSINGYILSEVIYDADNVPCDGIILDVNQTFEAQFGLKRENILGKSAVNLFHVFKEKDVLRFLKNIAGKNENQRFKFHFDSLNKDFLIASYAPENGKVAIIFSDITELICTEEKLRRSGEQYRTLFETMAQGVLYLDPEGKILSINPAAESILKISRESDLGRELNFRMDDVLRLDMTALPEHLLPHNIAFRTGHSVIDSVLCLNQTQPKDCLWINVSAIPQYHEGETEPFQVIVIFLDVTDRIRMQKALEERVKELRCISNVSRAIQRDYSIEEICQVAVQELVPAMRYPNAVAVVELAEQRFVSEEYYGDIKQGLTAPILTNKGEFGHVAVYYKDDNEFIIPEEELLLQSIAERLASYCDRRHTQNQLRKSEERFRKAIMDAPIPIMIFNADGEILTANHAWLWGSGYSIEEIPTLTAWQKHAFRGQDDDVLELINGKNQLGNVINEGEFTVHTKSGEERLWLITTGVLETLTNGKIIAISMARDITKRNQAEKDRERYYERILALREVDKVIGSTLNLNNVLGQITSQMGKLIPFDSMAVQLLNGNRLQIIAVQGFDDPEDLLGLSFPSEPDYPNFEVLNQKKPVCYKNISESYPLFTQPAGEEFSGAIKTWLGVPLIHQDTVIGMFSVDREEEKLFSEDDIAIAMGFANRAAVAITNAQLYEQMRSQVQKLEILRKIDAAITGEMSLEESLVEILNHIKQGLGVDAASILLYDEKTSKLTSEQGVGFIHKIRKNNQINLGQGFTGKVALACESLFIPKIKISNGHDRFPIDLEGEGITSYYGFPLLAKGKLEGVLEIFTRTPLEPDEEWTSFAEALAGQAAIAVNNISLITNLETANENLIEAYDATIEGWAHALELRDQETEGHSRRVVDMTLKIARRFGFDEEQLHHLRRGVLLHDIGKMGIPDEILRKPGPLTEVEWDFMRLHPVFAYDMLKDIDYLHSALIIPRYHHERWDGSGYPEGLVGKEIPLEARIFAVVDVWDALLSDRYYRDAWPRDKVFEYINDQAGKLLDPDVVSIFVEVLEGK